MHYIQKKTCSYDVSISTSDKMDQDSQDAMDCKKAPLLGYRHLYMVMGFLVYFSINAQRLSLSVAIVAMVNQTRTTETITRSDSSISESCPVYNFTSEALSRNREVEKDFDWNSELQGYVLGAGFLGFVLTQAPGGRMAEKYGAKIIISVGSFISGLCTIMTPLASSFHVYLAIAIQLFRGMAQGILYPAVYVLMASWFPVTERGFLSTVILAGFPMGALFGGLLAGWICDITYLRWPAVFYLFGLVGIIVGGLFVFFFYDTPSKHPRISSLELKYITQNQSNASQGKLRPPWGRIFTSTPIYALLFGLFGQFWAFAYFLSAHPTYLGTVLHFNMTQNGLVASIPFVFKVVGGLISSWISDWLSRNNYVTVDKLRKGCNFLGCLGFTLCLIGVYIAGCNHVISVLCFCMATFSMGIAIPGSMITCTDMAPRFAGSIMGILSSISSTATFILPFAVGLFTTNHSLDEWHIVFIISISVVLSSGIVFSIFGSANVQPWNFSDMEDDSNVINIDPLLKNVQTENQ